MAANEIFTYADESSDSYGLYICNIDGSSDAVGGSELSNNQTQIVGTDEFVIVNNTYSSTLSFSFQVGMFKNCVLTPIEANDYSQINRWLNRKEDHKLKINMPGYENIYFLGRFNISPAVIGDKMWGIKLTFTSSYPYGFADEIKQIFYGKNFTIYSMSDEVGTQYPVFEITVNEAGTLELQNSLDNEVMIIDNCVAGEVITIDSKHKTITTSETTHKIYNDFNWNYPKLCNEYYNRINEFTSTLDIKMEFTYSPVRKVGMY